MDLGTGGIVAWRGDGERRSVMADMRDDKGERGSQGLNIESWTVAFEKMRWKIRRPWRRRGDVWSWRGSLRCHRHPFARRPSVGSLPYTTKPSTIQFARSKCRKEDKRKTEGRFLDISPVSRCSRSQFFTHFLDVSMSAFAVGCVVFRVNQINIQLVLIIFSVSGYFVL
jgi:hypothetical protein